MAVRPLYSNATMAFLWKYANGLVNVSAADKQEKIRLQKEIFVVRQSILKLREEIRNSQDKFSASAKIGELKAEKSKLAGKLKKLSGQNPFLKLNTEEKSALCLSVLLQKYLTNELAVHPEFLLGQDQKGVVTVNVEALKASELFQQIQHINDYVAAYVGNHTDKVISPGYFITLLGNNKNWRNLYDTAEAYFAEQRQREARDPAEQDNIRASREGVEVVKTYPESGLQAVRLLTKEALDYEGKEMGHCIGGGSYDRSLEDGSRQYYSIRELSADGEWKPHVTFECEKDKIRQCKGKNNTAVIGRYLKEARDFACRLLGTEDLLKSNAGKFPDLVKLGYQWADGKICDIYASVNENFSYDFACLSLRLEELKNIEILEKIKVNALNLSGTATQNNLAQLARVKQLKYLNFKNVNFGCMKKLDLSFLQNFYRAEEGFRQQHEKLQQSGLSYIGGEICFGLESVIEFDRDNNMHSIEEICLPKKIGGCRLGFMPSLKIQKSLMELSGHISEIVLDGVKVENEETLDFSGFGEVYSFCCQGCDFSKVEKVVWPESKSLALKNVNLDSLRIFDSGPQVKTLEIKECSAKKMEDFEIKPQVENLKLNNSGDFVAAISWSQEATKKFKKLDLGFCRNALEAKVLERMPAEMEELSFCGAFVPEKFDADCLSGLQILKSHLCCGDNTTEIVLPASLKVWEADEPYFPKLKRLDLRNLNALEKLILTEGDFNELEELYLPENLRVVSFVSSRFPKLERLDLSRCRNLERINFIESKLGTLEHLWLPECVQVEMTAQSLPEDCQVFRVTDQRTPACQKKIQWSGR